MNRPESRRQRWAMIRLAFAAAGVILVFCATRWTRGLFRRPTLADLRFPVLVLPPQQQEPFFASEPGELTTVREKSGKSPADGTILIDSDFKQYEEVEVHAKPVGEISAIFHALIPSPRSYHYTLQLRRSKTSGLTAALAQLAACGSYPGEPTSIDRKRGQLSSAKTVDQIIAIISADPLPMPVTLLPREPDTEPVEIEKPPGDVEGR